jgi:ADP-ribose pyrophosphatase YjhB (NUDIX family)
MEDVKKFEVAVLGVIYNPKDKKILIGRRENDPNIPKLGWSFPGGRLRHGEDMDKVLKKHIKSKTGYDVKNLGAIFSRTPDEKKDLVIIYFLTEVFKGKEKPGIDMLELKWVKPEELEKHFKTSFHPRLKEYILNLK